MHLQCQWRGVVQLRDAAIPPSLCPSRRVTRQPAAASHPVSRCCHCTWDIKRVRALACLLGICMLDLHIRPNVHVRVSAPTLTRHGGRHELAVKVMTCQAGPRQGALAPTSNSRGPWRPACQHRQRASRLRERLGVVAACGRDFTMPHARRPRRPPAAAGV